MGCGREWRGPAPDEAVEVANGSDERFLRDVLRRAVIVHDQERRPVRAGPGHVEQLGGRALRSTRRLADDRTLAACMRRRHWRDMREIASRYCHPAVQPNARA